MIVTGGPAATRAAKEATATIPIVMAHDDDPVAERVRRQPCAAWWQHHWVVNPSAELHGKRLELLKEIVPRLSRVAVLGTSTRPGNALP